MIFFLFETGKRIPINFKGVNKDRKYLNKIKYFGNLLLEN
jgi:hypothetical protein